MASSVIKRENVLHIDGISLAHHDNITNVETLSIDICARIAVVTMVFTVGTLITETNAVLFSGLPNASYRKRFRAPHGYSEQYPDLVLSIEANGTICNQWSQGGVRAGQYQTEFVYIIA